LNLSKISEIFLDDKEAIQEVLDMLEETIPEFLVNLQKNIEAENLPQFKFTIHKFKSSCQLLTDPAFIELIRTIEHTDADEISDIAPLVDQLKTCVSQ